MFCCATTNQGRTDGGRLCVLWHFAGNTKHFCSDEFCCCQGQQKKSSQAFQRPWNVKPVMRCLCVQVLLTPAWPCLKFELNNAEEHPGQEKKKAVKVILFFYKKMQWNVKFFFLYVETSHSTTSTKFSSWTAYFLFSQYFQPFEGG